MLTNVIKHWKTSLAGLGLSGTAVYSLLQAGCGAKDWKSWGVAIGIAALGLFAKDPGLPKP